MLPAQGPPEPPQVALPQLQAWPLAQALEPPPKELEQQGPPLRQRGQARPLRQRERALLLALAPRVALAPGPWTWLAPRQSNLPVVCSGSKVR